MGPQHLGQYGIQFVKIRFTIASATPACHSAINHLSNPFASKTIAVIFATFCRRAGAWESSARVGANFVCGPSLLGGRVSAGRGLLSISAALTAGLDAAHRWFNRWEGAD
ncbi:hypothetical protein ZHAS_00013624 [Anopheles sinensis]|uniref:Uncharacterized protein n=1 Tax=Anopheles sinensis TaxID=74873 RepID=A0A084W5Y7_ANOSI|nr:hypothetical protein ZHAS_00013624 [Anopheles sinensis]